MKQRIYIAYGSNMSEVQMARRCPDAVLSGTGRIRGYEAPLSKGSLDRMLRHYREEGGCLRAGCFLAHFSGG